MEEQFIGWILISIKNWFDNNKLIKATCKFILSYYSQLALDKFVVKRVNGVGKEDFLNQNY